MLILPSPWFLWVSTIFSLVLSVLPLQIVCIISIVIISWLEWPDLLLIVNWQILDVWNWCCCHYCLSFFGPQKLFQQVFLEFHHFSYNLYRITVTNYIVDKKANNFEKTFGFIVTIAVTTCDSFLVYVFFTSTSFVDGWLSVPYLLRLCLLWLDDLFALSTSSVLCSVCIYCLYLVYSVCVYCVLVSCLLHLRFP